MITLLDTGTYKLIETKNHVKILTLNGKPFAWVKVKNIGDILVVSAYPPHSSDYSLSMGNYDLYNVEDEPYLTDLPHLELEFGKNAWQGYLLLTGLPTAKKRRSRIVPTTQIITGNPRYSSHMGFPGFAEPSSHVTPKRHLVRQR